MKKEDLLRQKQMMLIEVLHNNSIRTVNNDGTENYITRERMTELGGMTEEEVDKLIDACQRLYPPFVAADVARNMAMDNRFKHTTGAYDFIFNTCLQQGYIFIHQIDLSRIEDFSEFIAEDNYKTYMARSNMNTIDRVFEEPIMMETIMKCYVRKYIKNVIYCLGQGYAWDVICKMAQIDITTGRFAELIKATDIGG